MRIALFLFVVALSLPASAAAQEPAPDGPALLVQRIETALAASDAAAYRALFGANVARDRVESYADYLIAPGVTRAVVRERDRSTLASVLREQGYRLMVETFFEQGRQATIRTYSLTIRRLAGVDQPTLDEPGWRIEEQDLLSAVDGLFRLQLNPDKQFSITNLSISAEDFVLSVASGTAFVSETPQGITSMVVLGNGEMRFSPPSAAERGQIRLFCGEETLVASTSAMFIRVNPYDFGEKVKGGMTPRTVDRRELARAEAIFSEEVGKSFALDLSDLSREPWSLTPTTGDFLAEVRTRRYDTLTFAQAAAETEDITLFDRNKKRTISVYSSQRMRERRGEVIDEDEIADYDILDYDIEASYIPSREWLEGDALVKLQIRGTALATLTMKLHEDLTLRSVSSDQHGRLLAIRVRGQNNFIVNLPDQVSRGDVLIMHVSYGGRLPPPTPDREVVAMQGAQIFGEDPLVLPAPRYVFSNRSYWYPQGTITDFATARLRLSVPEPFVSIASGSPAASNPESVAASRPNEPNLSVSEFHAPQPVRYLSWLISELTPTVEGSINVPAAGESDEDAAKDGEGNPSPSATGVRYTSMDLDVVANSRQVGRSRGMVADAERILEFYAGLVGDVPYPTLTLAVVDNQLPGGHSPAYLALLYQPLPTSPFMWRNDPVYFDNFPQFFLAHELAHQFWGQAIGWKSYHEQWISEGFAQYFAALYAQRHGAPNTFRDVVRRMRRTVMDNEQQGPIFLGYRLGHIRGDSRVFRAIIYNKGAMVLHMLRGLLGDEPFFAGIRHLYQSSRFTKIGTDDVLAAFETVSGQSLGSYFEHWVYESALPRIRWSWRPEGPGGDGVAGARNEVTPAAGGSVVSLRFDQDVPAGSAFSLPVTVTLIYADGSTEDHTVPILEASTTVRLPVQKPVRNVEINEDSGLGRFEKD